jgi:hypothetical protein
LEEYLYFDGDFVKRRSRESAGQNGKKKLNFTADLDRCKRDLYIMLESTT